MDVSKDVTISRINELRILKNVRVLSLNNSSSIISGNNLRAQFEISGDLKGTINCYLFLDNKDLSSEDKNYLFPLFVESMNILLGKQISINPEFDELKIKLNPPKINLNPITFNMNDQNITQRYELQLAEKCFDVIVEYSLKFLS